MHRNEQWCGSPAQAGLFCVLNFLAMEQQGTEVHLFRGPGRVFGVTQDPTGSNLPSKFSPWTFFKTMRLSRDHATPGVDPKQCLDDIDKYGFHITDAHVRITEQAL